MTTVTIPATRLPRWCDNFAERHGSTTLSVDDGALVGRADDGSHFHVRLPFSRSYDGAAVLEEFAAAADPPDDWGILLVRKGGFAIARLTGTRVTGSKVGQRHVQGRTKAGGQSQQRFARRRGNQARAAYEAAAEHAVRLVGDVPVAVVGGDAGAVAAVMEDSRLHRVRDGVVGSFLTVPDPRRSVLEEACLEAGAFTIVVVNA